MVRYGLQRKGYECFFTDEDLKNAGLPAGKDGLETAAANLIASLLMERNAEPKAAVELTALPKCPGRFRFLLHPSSALQHLFRAAELTDYTAAPVRKADIRDVRTALEAELPFLLKLRHDPVSGTRYTVCWGGECVTGGEAGDRWKLFVSDGRSSSPAEVVLWDLKDATFLALCTSAG